jgi:hypothetical protein
MDDLVDKEDGPIDEVVLLGVLETKLTPIIVGKYIGGALKYKDPPPPVVIAGLFVPWGGSTIRLQSLSQFFSCQVL